MRTGSPPALPGARLGAGGQGGGNLIATGQDLADASDINNSPPNDPRYFRSDLFHEYLGAGFVQDDVFTHTATLERIREKVVAGERLDLDPGAVEDVEMGCVTQLGEQADEVVAKLLLEASIQAKLVRGRADGYDPDVFVDGPLISAIVKVCPALIATDGDTFSATAVSRP